MGITEVYPCGCNSFAKHSSDVDLVDCDELCPPAEPKPIPGNMLTCSSKRNTNPSKHLLKTKRHHGP